MHVKRRHRHKIMIVIARLKRLEAYIFNEGTI